MKWYTVKTQTNYEKKVVERLENEVRHLPNIKLNSLVPIEKTVYIRQGKRNFREKILYPGWIFIETNYPHELKQIMKNIAGCYGFLEEKKGLPTPLRDSDLERINVNMARNKEEELKLHVGEEVKILDGPFSDFIGTVEIVDNDKQTVTVHVKIFGKPTPVDLSLLHVTKDINGK